MANASCAFWNFLEFKNFFFNLRLVKSCRCRTCGYSEPTVSCFSSAFSPGLVSITDSYLIRSLPWWLQNDSNTCCTFSIQLSKFCCKQGTFLSCLPLNVFIIGMISWILIFFFFFARAYNLLLYLIILVLKLSQVCLDNLSKLFCGCVFLGLYMCLCSSSPMYMAAFKCHNFFNVSPSASQSFSFCSPTYDFLSPGTWRSAVSCSFLAQ